MLTSRLYKQSSSRCRHCGSALSLELINLGFAPPSNSYLSEESLHEPETFYPLRVYVCEACWLVQTEDFLGHDLIFSKQYAYFSSYSTSWVEHARCYVETMIARLSLNEKSLVVEIAANDGYLLQHVHARNIPCYGVEPTTSTAEAARLKGIQIEEEFFGRATAKHLLATRGPADLIVANNVLAHVPDINDFVSGFVTLLKPDGIATFEFPHILNLVASVQFDTIYHEHFCYLSLYSLCNVFNSNGLTIYDVEELSTHGGSLRLYASKNPRLFPVSPRIQSVLDKEIEAGINTPDYYRRFQPRADDITFNLIQFLIKCRSEGKSVIGYGAAAKGNTILNYAGIKPSLLPRIYDASPAKSGRLMPGSHIPIHSSKEFLDDKADFVLILPWNLTREIMQMYPQVADRGAKWVTAIPEIRIHG